MKCLSFLVDGDLFAVDVTLVREFARKMTVTPVPSAPDAVVGITNMKGRVITILSLSELLGRKGKAVGEVCCDTVSVILFKSLSGDEDQAGLTIDKPGELIEIDDQAVRKPSLTKGGDESFCISGIAEVEDRLYRIIDIYSIIERYKANGEKTVESDLNGGIDEDEEN